MANKKIVLLSYEFLFDPVDTWQHLSQFEEAFAKFLREHSMEGQILDSINPRDGRRILYIRSNKPPGKLGEDLKATNMTPPPKRVLEPQKGGK